MSVGGVVAFFIKQNLHLDVFNSLHAAGYAKTAHINSLFSHYKKETETLARSLYLEGFVQENEENDQEYKDFIEKTTLKIHSLNDADRDIYKIKIIDMKGKIVSCAPRSCIGEDKTGADSFLFGLQKTWMSDIHYSETIHAPGIDVATPIKNEEEITVGVLVVDYTTEELFSILTEKTGWGKTGESYLVNEDFLMVSPSLYNENAFLSQKVETPNAKACFKNKNTSTDRGIVTNILEERGYDTFLGYMGKNIIGSGFFLPQINICLLAEIQQSEIEDSFNGLAFILGAIIFLGCLFAIFFIRLISRKITEPISQLQEDTKIIGQGNFNHRSRIKSKNEIGILAQAFNAMTASLGHAQEEVEKKVQQQTREITQKALRVERQQDALLAALDAVKEEKNRVEELAHDLDKFRLAVENASDHIVITDTGGKILFANKAVESITGFSKEVVIGQKAGSKENWGGEMGKAFYEKMWKTIKEEKKVFAGEVYNRRKSGEVYVARASISPVLDKQKNVIFFIGIERDVTKEKQVDQAKTEFVSLASHQLRTPLTAIKWYSEMLLNGDAGELNSDQRDYLVEMARGNERMIELVNALLNTSRLELGTFSIEPVKTNIAQLLESIIKEMQPRASEKKVVIESTIDTSLNAISVDPKLMSMLFENILSNAVKYSLEEDSRVHVILEKKNPGEFVGNVESVQECIHYQVKDDGMGIPFSQKDRIFSKMFRADNVRSADMEGTGLGLYLVKSIVDHSGGSVWFESEEGKGSTFHILFPLSGMKKKEGKKKLS